MSKSSTITEKGWWILKLFIIREGLAQRDYKYNPFRTETPEYLLPTEHFYSYPRHINFMLDHKVSVPTASSWCEKFHKMRLLKKEPRRTEFGRAFQKTQHYYINPDLDPFKQILNIAIEHSSPRELIKLFGEYYFQSRITESLVREILFAKGVKMLTVINMLDWEPHEAEEVFRIWKRETDQIFQELQQAYVAHFYEENKESWDFATSNRWSQLTCMQIKIPVFPADMDTGEQMERISENFGSEPFRLYDNQLPYLNYASFLRDYQRLHEYNVLILPILALIKVSPNACLYFLSQNWQGFTFSVELFYGGQKEPSCDLLVNLFFLAINDMTQNPRTPLNSIVSRIHFRDIPRELDSKGNLTTENALAAVYLKNYHTLYYDVGFSTKGVESSGITPIPYQQNAQQSEGLAFWIKTWLKRQYAMWYQEIEIKDFLRLIELLQSDDPIGTRLRERFPNRMKNILSAYDKQKIPGEQFKKYLLNELNNVLECKDLYNEKAFAHITLSETTQELLECILDEKEWVDDPWGLKDMEVIQVNRRLLDEAFPDIFSELGSRRWF